MKKQEQLNKIDYRAVLSGELDPMPVEYFEDYLAVAAENPSNGVTVVKETLMDATVVIRDSQDPNGAVWVENFTRVPGKTYARISTCNQEDCFVTTSRTSSDGIATYDAFTIDGEGNVNNVPYDEAQEVFCSLNHDKLTAYMQAFDNEFVQ